MKTLTMALLAMCFICTSALANERNEGISCIYKGTTVTATYDLGDNGTVRNRNVVVNSNGGGSYGCMGRCGGGCGWGAPSAYTKDCMDHDKCSLDLGASGGSRDPNCGDEFDHAADGWAWGVWRGCRG